MVYLPCIWACKDVNEPKNKVQIHNEKKTILKGVFLYSDFISNSEIFNFKFKNKENASSFHQHF